METENYFNRVKSVWLSLVEMQSHIKIEIKRPDYMQQLQKIQSCFDSCCFSEEEQKNICYKILEICIEYYKSYTPIEIYVGVGSSSITPSKLPPNLHLNLHLIDEYLDVLNEQNNFINIFFNEYHYEYLDSDYSYEQYFINKYNRHFAGREKLQQLRELKVPIQIFYWYAAGNLTRILGEFLNQRFTELDLSQNYKIMLEKIRTLEQKILDKENLENKLKQKRLDKKYELKAQAKCVDLLFVHLGCVLVGGVLVGLIISCIIASGLTPPVYGPYNNNIIWFSWFWKSLCTLAIPLAIPMFLMGKKLSIRLRDESDKLTKIRDGIRNVYEN